MSRQPANGALEIQSIRKIKLRVAHQPGAPQAPSHEMPGPSTRTRGETNRIPSGESATYASGRPARGVAMKKSASADSTNDSEEGSHGQHSKAALLGRRTTRRSTKVEEEQLQQATIESQVKHDDEDEEDEGDYDDEDAVGEDDEDVEMAHDPSPALEAVSEGEDSEPIRPKKLPKTLTTRTGRTTNQPNYADESSDEFENGIGPDEDEFLDQEIHELGNGQQIGQMRRSSRKRGDIDGFVVGDDDEDEDHKRRTRTGGRDQTSRQRKSQGRKRDPDEPSRPSRSRAKAGPSRTQDEDYDGAYGDSASVDEDDDTRDVVEEDDLNLHDGDTGDEDSVPQPSRRATRSGGGGGGRRTRGQESTDDEGVPRTLRARKQINYAIPLPLEELPRRGDKSGRGVRIGGTASGIAAAAQNGGFLSNMNLGIANEMATFGNMPDSDSDNDAPQFVKDLRKEASANAGMALASGGPADPKGVAGGAGPTIATAGVDALGRFNPEAARADADPLGVDLNVTFDQVGGLDDQINQLKEMVALPLLYPELFHQFGIIPPRGVLFHGPPGTGKTLLARALAASCSTSTTKISFFMRKGADCLSKWVGEAERQLKLLFEEARNAQPSIIFFDEIDGLAPVRSSKQDQIHSSLVATLLALMDGMDGRGQVVVIGATNRPDTVDPALRRPGRFDREFYFALPNKVARKKIIAINTRKWDPPLEDLFLEELAGQTKGYGGADLRALCTEAALNAIQRTFPQVYKTSDRLLLNPNAIRVTAKDFMASIRKIVPSSARSAASSASPLPDQLVPLLTRSLDRTKKVVDQLLPPKTRPTVLEDAEWEEEENSLEREMILQSLETLRVYRPRLLIHSPHNLGQRFIGSAILHHMEGYHVQSLDVASLLAQTGGSVETAIVQMFVEAKRHQPSVLYIPSLTDWITIMPDTAKTTLSGLLESLTPSEPVLVLALLQGEKDALPHQIANWFGKGAESYLELSWHDENQRGKFFDHVVENLCRKPTDFPDGIVRKRRVLENLPLAPPLPPKAPSQASVAAQAQKDQTLREIITYRLGPILAELKKKYKKSTLSAQDAYFIYSHRQAEAEARLAALPNRIDHASSAQLAEGHEAALPVGEQPAAIHHIDIVTPSEGILPATAVGMERVLGSDAPHGNEAVEDAAQPAPHEPQPGLAALKPSWVDFDLMQNKLMDPISGYLTLRSFLRDIERMAENINIIHDETDRRQKGHTMVVETKLMLKDHFQDEQQKIEMERMAAREHARREAKAKTKEDVAPGPSTANGAPSPARVNGRTAGRVSATASPVQRTSGSPNPRKRQRPDVVTLELSNDAGAHKRSRLEGGELRDALTQSGLNDSRADGSSHNAVAGSSLGVHWIDPHVSGARSDLATLVNGSHSAAPSSLASLMNPAEVRAPEPEFYVPPDQLRELQRFLCAETADLDVEELEQIRATCLQRVWKGRKDWDRTSVVQDLLTKVAEYVDQALPERLMMEP